MVAVSQLVTPPGQDETGPALIHVRFLPDGDIFTIDACPETLTPQTWFGRLYKMAPDHYKTLAGGRGFFCIPRDRYTAILDQDANAA